MKRTQILNTIKSLACSCGSYGRFYNQLIEAKKNDYERYDAFMKKLEAQNFKESVDLVMYLEG